MLLKLALLMTGLWVLAIATGAFMHTGTLSVVLLAVPCHV